MSLSVVVVDKECCCPDLLGQNMLLREFWLRFLYRRVKVFDKHKNFNYNETHDNLGRTLMEVMLREAESLLDENHSCEWHEEKNYSEVIYDFKEEKAPEFRLVCTSPKRMDPEKSKKLESLDFPSFMVPTDRALKDMQSLVRYLYLKQRPSFSPNREKYLECVDESCFECMSAWFVEHPALWKVGKLCPRRC